MKVIDLFCGCGGFSEGFGQAGFEVVAAVDNCPKAIEAHAANHSGCLHVCADIGDIRGRDLPACDVLIGSPPCQQFSNANQHPDPEAGLKLVREFLRLVDELKPEYWIMENVPPIRRHWGKLRRFPKVRVYNAADFGVPQTRRRLFAGDFPDPVQTHAERPGTTLDGRRLERWVGWGEVVDVEKELVLVSRACENLHRTGREDRGRPPARPAPSIAANGRAGLFMVPATGETLHRTGKNDLGRAPDQPSHALASKSPRLYMLSNVNEGHFLNGQRAGSAKPHDKPAATVRAGTPHRIFTERREKVRSLTIEESALLQAFPPGYVFKGDRTRQIGNAVPPPMARALATAILREAPP